MQAIQADLVERIVAMAEGQSAHRQAVDMLALQTQAATVRRGQWMGLVVVLAVLGVSWRLIAAGHESAGTIIASVDMAGLTAAFVLGRRTPSTPPNP